MGLLEVVVILIIIGILLWLVNSYIPMDGKIKQILNVVVVIAVVLWLISLFFPHIWAHDIPLNSTHR